MRRVFRSHHRAFPLLKLKNGREGWIPNQHLGRDPKSYGVERPPDWLCRSLPAVYAIRRVKVQFWSLRAGNKGVCLSRLSYRLKL